MCVLPLVKSGTTPAVGLARYSERSAMPLRSWKDPWPRFRVILIGAELLFLTRAPAACLRVLFVEFCAATQRSCVALNWRMISARLPNQARLEAARKRRIVVWMLRRLLVS